MVTTRVRRPTAQIYLGLRSGRLTAEAAAQLGATNDVCTRLLQNDEDAILPHKKSRCFEWQTFTKLKPSRPKSESHPTTFLYHKV